jgi:hypothetical protein
LEKKKGLLISPDYSKFHSTTFIPFAPPALILSLHSPLLLPEQDASSCNSPQLFPRWLELARVLLEMAGVLLELARVLLELSGVLLELAGVLLELAGELLELAGVLLELAGELLELVGVLLELAVVLLELAGVLLELDGDGRRSFLFEWGGGRG